MLLYRSASFPHYYADIRLAYSSKLLLASSEMCHPQRLSLADGFIARLAIPLYPTILSV